MHKCAFQKRKVVEEVAPLIASYNFNNVGKLCKKVLYALFKCVLDQSSTWKEMISFRERAMK